MATLRQRISFLRRVEGGYLWLLILKKLGKKQARRVHGNREFRVPLDVPGGIQLMREGEDWMVPLLQALLPHFDGGFVDVGANVGHSLLQFRAVDDERPWVGFEPAPQSCATIRAVIDVNKIRNTHLLQAGLSDRAGETILYGVSGTDGSATMLEGYHGPGHPSQTVRTPVKVLDGATLAQSELHGPIAVIKIDVEGMELEVVKGLSAVIERDRPALVCEILPVPDDGTKRTEKLRARQSELQEVFRSLRYRLIQIGIEGGYLDVDSPDNTVNPHAGNYLVLPEERFDKIRPLL